MVKRKQSKSFQVLPSAVDSRANSRACLCGIDDRAVFWGICWCSTILSAPFGYSFTALIVLRLLLGLGEGVHIPMLSAITSRWFLPAERSRANAIWGSGILLSTTIAPLIVVPLIQFWGWRPTFAVLGIVGMLLSIPLVYFLVPDESQSASRQSAVDRTAYDEWERKPWVSYRRDHRFWLAVAGGSLNAFCAFGILN